MLIAAITKIAALTIIAAITTIKVIANYSYDGILKQE